MWWPTEESQCPEAEAEAEADVAMPPPEELEDWEQSIDEILEDERAGTNIMS
jgi:hypothetical protein